MENEKPKMTITLTGRAPVKITKDEWPVIASGVNHWYEGQYECQASRKKSWKLIVRQHADGRTLVYAIFAGTSQYQGEKDENVRAGKMVTVEGSDTAPIIAAIFEVAEDMRARSGQEEFARIAHECIADLPAVELS